MKIIIKGNKQLNLDPKIVSYIKEKIRKYEPMVKEPAVCEVILSDLRGPKGGVDKAVKIKLSLPGLRKPIFVSEKTSDFIGSIDLAQERLEQQVIKYKERVKIGSRFPIKYWLGKIYTKGASGSKWLIGKIPKRSKK